jgi:hypothetical protein
LKLDYTIMNKTKALALVQQQRRFWHSQEPDAAIARRAERVFFRMALVYFICATLLFAVGSTPRHHALAGLVAVFLVCGAAMVWRSRQFTQVSRVLSDAKADGSRVA